jgi:hypothetical protein
MCTLPSASKVEGSALRASDEESKSKGSPSEERGSGGGREPRALGFSERG